MDRTAVAERLATRKRQEYARDATFGETIDVIPPKRPLQRVGNIGGGRCGEEIFTP